MKQKIKNLKQMAVRTYIKCTGRVEAFAKDVSGSDTTEKIGMVVVAVIIVGLLAGAVKVFMPDLFNTIGNTAKEKLSGLFT